MFLSQSARRIAETLPVIRIVLLTVSEAEDNLLAAMKAGNVGGFEVQPTYPLVVDGGTGADAAKNLSGRFTVELKSPVAQARANVAVSGNLREPRFSR